MHRLNLRQLILLLSVSAALLILVNTFYTSHKTQRALLIEHTLKANQAYASKIADGANNFLLSAQQQLAYAAKDVLKAQQDPQQLHDIVQRLKQQSDSFNTVLIVDAQGIALAITQPGQEFLGEKMHNEGAAQALQERRPLLSKPYISVTGGLVVFLTHPVFDGQGVYQGFVGGAIYLHKESLLYQLLGQHYHTDDSYSYVIDSDGRLIYHRDRARIGETVVSNSVIDKVIKKQTGSQLLVNSAGLQMLAGYAPVPSAEWGVVTQRSLKSTLEVMDHQMLAVAKYSFPFFIVVIWLVWLISRWISKPLWQLARSAEYLDEPDANAKITDIAVWYFEASQMKRAMLRGLVGFNKKMGQLNLENITDPLTGLVNRRGMEAFLADLEEDQQSFSVLMADIDHFKAVNDKFGHAAGDKALQFFAQHMLDTSRPNDLVCRVGGEEFMIILPRTELSVAYKVAERLRERIAVDICPSIGVPVTLSIGVAHWPCGAQSVSEVIKNADQALYAAKQAGRNQVISSEVKCK